MQKSGLKNQLRFHYDVQTTSSSNDIKIKASTPTPEECIRPTEFLNYEHPNVKSWLEKHLDASLSTKKKAIRLYYLVRDGWKYNPYKVTTEREKVKVSHLITERQGYCTPKAMLLAATARAVGIPSRIGFGDVKNHLSSPALIEYLRSEIFAWHGFTELFIDEQWVRCTPAFDAKLCGKFNVAPMDFDGETDSLFQEFDNGGKRFMEYVNYRGVYSELPYEEMFTSLKEIYPHAFSDQPLEASLYDEAIPKG